MPADARRRRPLPHVFNGEIYNFPDLRRELSRHAGHTTGLVAAGRGSVDGDPVIVPGARGEGRRGPARVASG